VRNDLVLADPIGWYQVGWSAEFERGRPHALQFFGNDLVAYRDEGGALRVLDAYCLHMGAHLAHGGRVDGDGIVCPYHRWRWSSDGANTHVPDADRPNRAARLGVWHVDERHGCAYLWFHPDHEPPGWIVGDMFVDLPDEEGRGADDYYPAHPHGTHRVHGVTTHPYIAADNAVDHRHFNFVHRTPMPELIEYGVDTEDASKWRSLIGFRSPRSGRIAARLYLMMSGVGIVYTYQTAPMQQRVTLSVTPTAPGVCDLLLTTYLPRVDGDSDGTSHEAQQQYRAAERALPEDIDIWSRQRYTERPFLASYEARPVGEFRKWARTFAPAEQVVVGAR
jgi:nitrite reductase/ring-hydroxylating ferredoxin subunit